MSQTSPPQDPVASASPSQRLHPLSLLFRLTRHIRNLIPLLLLVLFTRQGQWNVWILLLFVPSIAYEIIQFLTLHYVMANDELVVRQGLIQRVERHIPYARIQNIDLVQTIWHRMFQVAEVRIETASGAEPEAILKVLSLDAIEAMRQRVFAQRPAKAAELQAVGEGPSDVSSAEPTGAPRQVLVQLAPSELVRLGVIANRGMAVVAIAMGLIAEFDLHERFAWGTWLESNWNQLVGGSALWTIVPLILAAVIVLTCFSIVWTLVRFHQFTLEQIGNDLRWRCGLLTRFSATIPRHHLQLISVQQSPLHRLFRRVTIRVNTAGGGQQGQEDNATVSRRWFVPVWPADRTASLVESIAPSVHLDELDWQPVDLKAWRRVVKPLLILALLLTGLAVTVWNVWGAIALAVLLPWAIWYARAKVRAIQYAVTADHLFFRSGVWTRRTSAVPREKVQVVSVRQSPFDRRWGMARLHVDIAGANVAGHEIEIPFLRDPRARELLAELTHTASQQAFRW